MQYWHVFGTPSKVMLQAKPMNSTEPNSQNLFNVISGGREADYQKVVENPLEEITKLVVTLSQNDSIKVREVRWISHYR